jgi:hypothetical protein
MRSSGLKTLLLVVVWSYAGATWASIGHHLMGLPEITGAVAFASAVGALAWSARRKLQVPSDGRRVGPEEVMRAG